MQSRNPVFADLADLMTDAFSAAQAAGSEARAVFRTQAERMASDLDLVSREEFEALKTQADKLKRDNESLVARLDALEKKATKPKTTRKRSTTKKSSS